MHTEGTASRPPTAKGLSDIGVEVRVDSLLEFKSFFFLKGVQGNALSFLSALSFLNSASDESTGHLLSRE
jgi:hypothetical protein